MLIPPTTTFLLDALFCLVYGWRSFAFLSAPIPPLKDALTQYCLLLGWLVAWLAVLDGRFGGWWLTSSMKVNWRLLVANRRQLANQCHVTTQFLFFLLRKVLVLQFIPLCMHDRNSALRPYASVMSISDPNNAVLCMSAHDQRGQEQNFQPFSPSTDWACWCCQ